MTQTADPGDGPWLHGIRDVLTEAVMGGAPGQGTGFLDGTKADGSGNHGVLATLAALTAAQASDPTVLGLSVAAHAAHLAFHLEVGVRWVQGERGPFDWQGSFGNRRVTPHEWTALQARVRAAYEGLLNLSPGTGEPPQDAGGLTSAVAHVAYHLGAVRQLVKLL